MIDPQPLQCENGVVNRFQFGPEFSNDSVQVRRQSFRHAEDALYSLRRKTEAKRVEQCPFPWVRFEEMYVITHSASLPAVAGRGGQRILQGGAHSIFTQPPILCVEILSPEDRIIRIMNLVRDSRKIQTKPPALQPIERRGFFARQVQEQCFQRSELLAVVFNRPIAGKHRDVALPDQLAGLDDDGHPVAQALHRL